MLRNWNVVKWSSLLAAMLAINTTPVQAQEELKDIQKSLNEISKKLDDLKALESIVSNMKTMVDKQDEANLKLGVVNASLTNVTTEVAALKKEIEKIQGREFRAYPPDKGGLDDRLAKIEAALERLEQSRVVAKAPPAMPTGRILMVNQYPEDMLFKINGRLHRVYANSTKVLENQPPGEFLYEVIWNFGVIKTNNPVLEAGKTYTITVRY